jgi:tRNA dimethylallyltransferase
MPLLAGGTMLYFKALRDGLNNLPTANPEIRIEIETQAAAIGWPAMHTKLGVIDPVTAARLSPNDSQRVGRALEIWRISGKPMSELLGHAQQTDAPVPTVTISLEPSDRSVLHTRIEQRFDLMLETGFIEEVRALHQRKDLHTGLPSVRCVGYRQIWSMLEGEISLEQAREQAIAATRQLAKRQLTWLRSLPGRLVVDSLSQHAVQEVIDLVAQQHTLNTRMHEKN